MNRYQCGFAIVDECHKVKYRKGYVAILEKMQTAGPNTHFWFMAVSGMFVNPDPSDTAGPMSRCAVDADFPVMPSPSFQYTRHPNV